MGEAEWWKPRGLSHTLWSWWNGWRVSLPLPQQSRCPAQELVWLWFVNQGKAAPSLPALRMGEGCCCLLRVRIRLSPCCTHQPAWGTKENLGSGQVLNYLQRVFAALSPREAAFFFLYKRWILFYFCYKTHITNFPWNLLQASALSVFWPRCPVLVLNPSPSGGKFLEWMPVVFF